ncbi:hypothetical protein CI109_100323 [Kwoniella shandongensis]|uniref:Uncharacterized protein n=1 Tax=Kwoniella shandongensis TaxID=1734106 RepID=A0A5M6C542_9TREE|nr:uncharacterized protein CI109_001831 [Kwoniella shandongensis]KAA5529891.1 hypothetical protein CI109_001831 [Kwoniella shandongensis]
MVQPSSTGKNLWVAASDGDLERVQYLIEHEGATPNDKDSNSYTPMHAAASYAHLPLLTYLLSVGGNPNIPDDDGDTPLFVVESLEVAQFLVQSGADAGWKNEEGMMASDSLEEDHPEISTYLRSLLPASESDPTSSDQPTTTNTTTTSDSADDDVGGEGQISQLALDNYTTAQTSYLLAEAQSILEQSALDGSDPDERLREVVERAVREGLQFGRNSAGEIEVLPGTGGGGAEAEVGKRAREE